MPNRIIFIHGFGSNPSIMEEQQIGPLKQKLEELGFQIEFIQGRYKLTPDDYPYSPPDRDSTKLDLYSWWDLKRTASLELTEPFLKSLDRKEDPIVGVIGFSQGGALATLIGANYKQWIPSLKFAISFSGFLYPNYYSEPDLSVYHDKIDVPFLTILGESDDLILPELTIKVTEELGTPEKVTIFEHPGAHEIPIDEENIEKVVDWIKKVEI